MSDIYSTMNLSSCQYMYIMFSSFFRKSEHFDLATLIYEFTDESIGHNYEFNLRLLYTRTTPRHPSHTPATVPGHSWTRFRFLSKFWHPAIPTAFKWQSLQALLRPTLRRSSIYRNASTRLVKWLFFIWEDEKSIYLTFLLNYSIDNLL